MRLLICLFAVLLIALPEPASAAPSCSVKQMRAGTALARSIERTAPRCRTAKPRAQSVATVCRKCRPLLVAINRFDQWAQNNKGCFTQSNPDRYILNVLSHYRSDFRLFRQFCSR